MMTDSNLLVMLFGLSLSVRCLAGDHQAYPRASAVREDVKVLDLVIVSTNEVIIGTSTMSLATATNLLDRQRERFDVVVVHGSVREVNSREVESTAMARIARVVVPLVVVEQDGEYAWREQSGADGIRTLKMGTDQFAVIRRLWMKTKDDDGTPAGPALETTVEWDTATGTYELKRVELGLFGKHVWLMHEQADADSEADTVGILFKKEW